MTIKHPDLDPAVITSALRVEPQHSWKKGEPRVTPSGSPLPGLRRESYWCYTFSNVENREIAELIESAVRSLPQRSTLWSELQNSGGSAMLILQVVGTKYQGAVISSELIAKLAQLGIALGIEVYAVPQNG